MLVPLAGAMLLSLTNGHVVPNAARASITKEGMCLAGDGSQVVCCSWQVRRVLLSSSQAFLCRMLKAREARTNTVINTTHNKHRLTAGCCSTWPMLAWSLHTPSLSQHAIARIQQQVDGWVPPYLAYAGMVTAHALFIQHAIAHI